MIIKSQCQHCNSVEYDVETYLEPYGEVADDVYIKVELCQICAATSGAIAMEEYENV